MYPPPVPSQGKDYKKKSEYLLDSKFWHILNHNFGKNIYVEILERVQDSNK